MNKIIIILSFLIFLPSCREEIIPPDNPAGNINQPVKDVFHNSYSFIINAGDITLNQQDYVKFDISRIQVFISIMDYISGSVEISLTNKAQQVIFNKKADSEIKGEYARVNYLPDAVYINFKDFTGKFKLTLNQY